MPLISIPNFIPSLCLYLIRISTVSESKRNRLRICGIAFKKSKKFDQFDRKIWEKFYFLVAPRRFIRDEQSLEHIP